jgi:hypothetical protein
LAARVFPPAPMTAITTFSKDKTKVTTGSYWQLGNPIDSSKKNENKKEHHARITKEDSLSVVSRCGIHTDRQHQPCHSWTPFSSGKPHIYPGHCASIRAQIMSLLYKIHISVGYPGRYGRLCSSGPCDMDFVVSLIYLILPIIVSVPRGTFICAALALTELSMALSKSSRERSTASTQVICRSQ